MVVDLFFNFFPKYPEYERLPASNLSYFPLKCSQNKYIFDYFNPQIYGAAVLKERPVASSFFRVVTPVGVALEYRAVMNRINTAFVLAITNQLPSKAKVGVSDGGE